MLTDIQAPFLGTPLVPLKPTKIFQGLIFSGGPLPWASTPLKDKIP